MQSLRFILQPLSAFGSRPLGDTLFGQLCWAVRNRHGEGRLVELLAGYTEARPWAVVSDVFPSGYLPRPSLPGHWYSEVAGEDRKAVKKRAWFPADKLTSIPVRDWLSHCRPAAEVPGSTPQSHPQPHNTLNRMTGTTGEGQFAPYAMSQLWYGRGNTKEDGELSLDVYVVLDENRLNRDELAQLFEDIGNFGFGRDASIGLGKFQVFGVETFVWPRPVDANAYLTLAPCAPRGQGFDPQRSFYQTFTRFGRHGDVGVHFGNPFKTPVLLAQTGAVFSPTQEPADEVRSLYPSPSGRRWPEGPDEGERSHGSAASFAGRGAVQSLPQSGEGPGVRAFVGQGLGGDGSLSKAIVETVQQGYAPVVEIRLPSPEPSSDGRGSDLEVA